MQITTLNRVISLFLIGVVAIGIVAAAEWERIECRLDSNPLPDSWAAPIGVAAGIVLTAAAVMAGVLIDAGAEFFVRNLVVYHLLRKERLGRFSRHWRRMTFWRNRLNGLLQRAELPREEEFSFAAGFFFSAADSRNTDWLVQNYSIFLLETNAVVLALGASILFWEHSLIPWISLPLSALLLVHCFIRSAFVYELVFRTACIDFDPRLRPRGAVSSGAAAAPKR